MFTNGSVKTIKYAACFVFFYSGLLGLSLYVLKRLLKRKTAIVLMYHRLIDDQSRYLDKGMGSHCHIRVFEKQLSYLKGWYNMISMDDLVAWLCGTKDLETPAVAFTFDDGYKDNYTLAFPILKKLKVPATIYLISGLVGTNKRTWTAKIEHILLHTPVSKFQIYKLFGDETLDVSTPEGKEKVNIMIAEALKKVENQEKVALLAELSNKLSGGELKSSQEQFMLTWDEVMVMSREEISFGAHTLTHPILTRIPLEEAKREILLSKKLAEKELGVPIKHFAIPNGRSEDFNEELRKFCIDIGFQSIVTTNYGNISRQSDRYTLKRITASWPLHIFAFQVAKAVFF